ncbi:site-specific integrase [Zobellella sp. An-6]|uniref:site-specific integrase n=1 Tax=Zobellella sp. An-6 TaxID=3400218 RepID=UPI0040421922
MGSGPFLNRIRQELRLRGYSLRTEKTYLHWIKRYIRFHHLSHPAEMGAPEVRAFLSWLANAQHVAVNTQKTALNALAFMYHKVLNIEQGELGFQHASQYRRIVLTQAEVALILEQLDQRNRLIFSLLYGDRSAFHQQPAGQPARVAIAAYVSGRPPCLFSGKLPPGSCGRPCLSPSL